MNPDAITEETFEKYLFTAGIPDPDLIIRSSGEKRMSNYLLWQASYSELWFSDVLWPDFRLKHLLKAVREYNSRNRRFGGVKQ
jgi:undecaprenyl diphosphate synthase